MMDPSYPFVPPEGTRKRTTSSSANAPGTSRGEPARRSRKRPLSATAVLSQPTASPSSSTPPPSAPPARASMSAAQLLSRAMNRSSAPPPAASLPEAPPAAAENPTQEPPRKRARHVKKLLAQALALSRSCAHDATAAAMAAAGRSAVSESSGSGFSSDEDIECGRLEQVLQEVVNNLAKTHQRVTGLRDLAQRNVLEMQPPMQPPMFQVRVPHVPMYSPMPVPMHPALPRSQAQQQRLLMRAQAQEQRESDRSFWPLLCFSPEQRVHMVQAARELARKPEHALHNLPLALSFSDCGNLVSKLVPKPLGLEDVPYVNVDLAGSINSCSAPFSKQLNAGTPEDLVGDAIRQYFESSADIARVEKELQLIGSRQCDMTINIVTMLSRDRTCAVDVLDLCMGVRDKSGALCAFRAYTFPFATRAARVKTARPGDEPST